jgi:protein-tyrosine phosphatase
MAEAVFAHKVRLAGLEEAIYTDSCGTGGWHVGEAAHPGTRRILTQKGVAYNGRARCIDPEDLHSFHHVLAMDEANLADLERMGAGSAKVELLLTYAPEAGHRAVPDPYYDGRFELVYDLVDKATDGLLAAIRNEHDL